MCGRFIRTSSSVEIFREFGLSGFIEDLQPRYNIAPSQLVDVVVRQESMLRIGPMRWGLAARPGGPAPINVRGETVAQRFREAFARRRCLIVADGFYEWKASEGRKVPYFFCLRSRRPFGFAGVWTASVNKAGERLGTCALITCEPNEVVRPVHDRMPVVLTEDSRSRWLDPAAPPSELTKALTPLPASLMEAWEVSLAVNSPRNDGPKCIEKR